MQVTVAMAVALMHTGYFPLPNLRGLHGDISGYSLGDGSGISGEGAQVASDGRQWLALPVTLKDNLPLDMDDQLGNWTLDVGGHGGGSGSRGRDRGRCRRGSWGWRRGGTSGAGRTSFSSDKTELGIEVVNTIGYLGIQVVNTSGYACQQIGGLRGTRRRGGGGVGVLDGECICRAIFNHNAARKTLMGVNILILQPVRYLEFALALIVLRLKLENRAVLDLTAWVRAGVNRLLQNTRFPALDEIAVITESSWVAVGEDELATHVLEGVGVPDSFKHEGNNASFIALGASAVHHEMRIGHVGFVIIRVDIFTVPARGEHNF